MSTDIWNEIVNKVNDHAYMGEIDRDAHRVKATAEIFTPTNLVVDMLQKCDLFYFAPGKTILDPACGDGQFLCAIKWAKILFHKMTEEEALNDIYGVDIMRDNVDLCRKRLGGGTIIMGDTLNPSKILEGQTNQEHDMMKKIFLDEVSVEAYFT